MAQNVRPAYITSFDLYPETTLIEKMKICEDVVSRKAWVVLMHDTTAGLYTLRKIDGKYIPTPHTSSD